MSFLSQLPIFSSGIDDLVEKATSENLPIGSEDWVTTLEIVDKIKSKVVPSSSAISSLKKRINNKNPNVQLLALKLTDACVKNCGDHFLVEVASKDFVDNLVSVARAYTDVKPEVRTKALGLLQTWGIAFRGKPGLYYMSEMYDLLKREGQTFPPVEAVHASAAMIDTTTAPTWSDSDVCVRCRTAFTTFNRKHHCRNCGQTFCNDCSSKKLPLPKLGITEPVRVCETCHTRLSSGVQSPSLPRSQSGTNVVRASEEDDDLAKAIAASLEISQYSSAPISAPSKKPTSKLAKTVHFESDNESDDEDLKRAIEASLKESEKKHPSSNFSYPKPVESYTPAPVVVPTSVPTSSTPVISQNPPQSIAPPEVLSTLEFENTRMFADLIDRLEAEVSQRGFVGFNASQVQGIYGQIVNVNIPAKLNSGVEEIASKYKSLYDLNECINGAVKAYDEYLQKRFATANTMYAPPSSTVAGYTVVQQQQAPQSYAPPMPYVQPVPGSLPPVATGYAPYPPQQIPDQAPYQVPPQQQSQYHPQAPQYYAYPPQMQPGQVPIAQQPPAPEVQEAPLIEL